MYLAGDSLGQVLRKDMNSIRVQTTKENARLIVPTPPKSPAMLLGYRLKDSRNNRTISSDRRSLYAVIEHTTVFTNNHSVWVREIPQVDCSEYNEYVRTTFTAAADDFDPDKALDSLDWSNLVNPSFGFVCPDISVLQGTDDDAFQFVQPASAQRNTSDN